MAPSPLTERQTEILKLISTFSAERGYPPTVRELGEALGIRSTNGVADHLRTLVTKGYLLREEQTSRALRLTPAALRAIGKRPKAVPIPSAPIDSSSTLEPLSADSLVAIPFYGRVAAGAPILAQSQPEEHILFDRTLLPQTQGVFALRIKGDSMIGDGIHDGDVVFVRSQTTAPRGAMVVVQIEGEATVKRYFPEGDVIRLQPSNPAHQPILIEKRAARDGSIAGVVVGLFRRV